MSKPTRFRESKLLEVTSLSSPNSNYLHRTQKRGSLSFPQAEQSASSHFCQAAQMSKSASLLNGDAIPLPQRLLYRIASSRHGTVLVAASSEGRPASLLLATPDHGTTPEEALSRELQTRFSPIKVEEVAVSNEHVYHILEQMIQLVDEIREGCFQGFKERALQDNMMLYGTDFQKATWSAMSTITIGRTCTYGELALKMGKSSTMARAISGACGKNNLYYLIPCHRVVASNGGLGGFRWGVKHKKSLLRREANQLFRHVKRGMTGGPV